MKHLYTFAFLLLFSCAFAQDARLFQNQWRLTNLIIGGADHFPPNVNMGIGFYEIDNSTYINSSCNSFFGSSSFPSENVTDFSFTGTGVTLLMCPEVMAYEGMYFGFFNDTTGPTNAFNYTISDSGVEQTLTIISASNDQAVYSNIELSTNSFDYAAVAVFPNPASDYLTVKINNPDTTNTRIKIYNLLGAECGTRKMDSGEANLYIGSLPSGVYTINISGDTGSTTKKFIKH